MAHTRWRFVLTSTGPPGETNYRSNTIGLRADVLTDPHRAAKVLTHELLHIARGPSSDPDEEAAVERGLAAVWVPFPTLAEAMSRPGATDNSIAAACGVTRATLNARYAALTTAEVRKLAAIRQQARELHTTVAATRPDPQAVIAALNTPTTPSGGSDAAPYTPAYAPQQRRTRTRARGMLHRARARMPAMPSWSLPA